MPTEPPTRRRGEALRGAIFDAVLDQLGEVGYARLSMEGVASAAGTGKAALYRRWAGKEELVRDTLRALLPSPPENSTGTDLREGLIAQLAYFDAALFDSKGAAFQAVAAESGTEIIVLREIFHDRVTGPCQDRISELVERHLGRRARSAPEAPLCAVGPAMLVYRCVNGHDRSTDQEVASIVDEVLLPLIERS